MTLDSLNAFTVTVALQSVLWKYSSFYDLPPKHEMRKGMCVKFIARGRKTNQRDSDPCSVKLSSLQALS